MARIVKEKEHTVKRNEILDVAQRLVYTKGYAQMSIQDILDDLKISKGAFYHYYTSKQALLEAVIDRMLQQAEDIVLPIVDDPHLTALEKIQRYFDTVARWKTDRIDLMLALLRIWYTDDNILVRQKVTAQGLDVIMPPLTKIIRQGIAEGTLATAYPDRVCEVIFSMMLAMSDKMAEILLAPPTQQSILPQLESTLEVYTDAIEHVLGVSSGSLCLIDRMALKKWIVIPATKSESTKSTASPARKLKSRVEIKEVNV
jgi:AcrR family transcriptional regulator